MKASKINLFITLTLAVQGLFGMSSYKSSNACEYANSNMEYIKDQTETAISSSELQIAKYYTYKAINGIEKTRSNFDDCGCIEAIETLDNVLLNLKEASKAETHSSSKKALQKALDNTTKAIQELEDYGLNLRDVYGDNMLVLNTKDVLAAQGGILLPEGKQLEQQIHNSLKNFEVSISKIVKQLDCDEARSFIKTKYENASIVLLNPDLTKPKKIYHQRVKTITKNALARLENCE